MRLAAPGAFLSVGLVLALVPFLRLPAFYESFLYLVFHWIVLATSWNILSGYSGYFSFGHGAFFGAGIYTTATLAANFGIPFLWTLPAAALVSATFGVGLGAIVFRVRRLRGELFALLTLAVTFVLATVVLNTSIDGGPGVYLSGVPLPKLFRSATSTFYVLGLVAAIGTLWVAHALFRSKLGMGLFAIHDDEDVAEVLGAPTYRYKLIVFGLSCGLAGIAGGIHAMFISYVTVSETFSILVPLNVVLMSVLGGTRHWLGPAVGATLVTMLLYAFTTSEYAVVGRAAVGLILIVAILFLPDGVLGQMVRKFRRRRPMAAPGRAARTAGAAVGHLPPSNERPMVHGRLLLECGEVRKAFRGIQALAGVTLEVREGEILGLVGPNGSGKSTMINVISGYFPPDSGRIVFAGNEISGIAGHRIARAGIARTYQIPRPFARMTVLDNVVFAARFGQTGSDRVMAEYEARRWLEFTGLGDKAAMLPAELNLHQRKFLELARALASKPRLVLLDEALSGLTPSEMADAIKLIRAIRDRGATIVFVEHIMRAVMDLTDRVVVLNYGEVIAEGLPRDVMRKPEVVTAYLGKAYA